MIALAWLCLVMLSFLLATGQAFLTASVPGYEPGLSSRTGSNAGLPASPSLTSANSNNPGKISIINGKMSLGSAANFGSRTSLVEPNMGTVEDSDENTSEDGGSSDELEYAMPAMPKPPLRHDEQTVYVIEFETEPDAAKGDGHRNRAGKGLPHDGTDLQSPLDPWSIVWYIGSFGGLVAFFLIVSCSEWCCRRGARPLSVPYTQRGEVLNAQPLNDSSPPPPYHLFAPPPYDSVNYGDNCYQGVVGNHHHLHHQHNLQQQQLNDCSKPEKLDIYVIEVPALRQLPEVVTSSNNPSSILSNQDDLRPPA